MKERLKKVLKKLNLYERISCWRHMLLQAKPSYVAKQFRYRLRGAPDGYPVPPALLVFRIIARGWAEQYYTMGRDAASEIVERLESNAIDPGGFANILDFGCGCGRLIRHFKHSTDAKLFGADYDRDLIRWCRRKLPFGEFITNDLEPPLAFEDGQFDFVYMISVFTHLSGELQRRWMIELRRVIQPGGILYFTTHGRPFFEFLSEDQKKRFENGEVVTIEKGEEGSNHYGSFESLDFVRGNLMEGFDLAAFSEGKERLVQDSYILRRR
jgi:SAM-dependent methyltransferase